jgi:adenosine deaminase
MAELNITEELIRALPKTDLHVHLDGSIRIPTLIELAKEQKIKLPSHSEEGLLEKVFRERYESLADYLHGFQYTCAVLQNIEALERSAYELAWDNINEGVYYIEPRFAPQLHMHDDLTFIDAVRSVDAGLRRARDEFNTSPAVVDEGRPPFEYGIIVCAMRMFTPKFSRYYAQLFSVHPNAPPKQVYGMASLELARAAVDAIQQYDLPIVGFDLAGQENGYPANDHVQAYQYAHAHFLKKTVHAGEAYGPESIYQAITNLHAERIGHGYHLFSPWLIEDDTSDRRKYVENLSQYIADLRITIEVCITSNLQTNPNLKLLEHHTYRDMLKGRLSATFCTDNRTISRTTVTDEVTLAVKAFHMVPRELRHYIIYGFKRSFFPGSYLEKRAYVRQMIDYYDSVVASFSEKGGADA